MENVAREGLAAVFHMDLEVWNFVQVTLTSINVNYFLTSITFIIFNHAAEGEHE